MPSPADPDADHDPGPGPVRDVDVWLLRLDDTAAGLADAHGLALPTGGSAVEWLDADERARAASLRDATDRQRWLLSHVALRLLVGRVLDRHPADVAWRREPCRRCGGPHGRPVVVDGGGLHLSLSRAGSTALVALRHGQPVGVDVERRAPAPDDALLRWVRTEAVLKSTGEGLTRDPAAVPLRDRAPGRWTSPVGGKGDGGDPPVEGIDLDLGDAALAAAAAGPALHRSALRVHLPDTAST